MEALAEAQRQAMERDSRVFVMGEDVGEIGGIFGVTRGLREQFGPERVRDTPISEGAIASAGVGAALTGLRPVIEIQIFGFVTLMMDMIVNQAAKARYMLGGRRQWPSCFAARRAGVARSGATFPEPGGLVHARARAGGDRALDPLRRQGAAAGRY